MLPGTALYCALYCTVLPGQVRGRDVLPPDLAEAQVLPLQLHPARSPHQHPSSVGPLFVVTRKLKSSVFCTSLFTLHLNNTESCQ